MWCSHLSWNLTLAGPLWELVRHCLPSCPCQPASLPTCLPSLYFLLPTSLSSASPHFTPYCLPAFLRGHRFVGDVRCEAVLLWSVVTPLEWRGVAQDKERFFLPWCGQLTGCLTVTISARCCGAGVSLSLHISDECQRSHQHKRKVSESVSAEEVSGRVERPHHQPLVFLLATLHLLLHQCGHMLQPHLLRRQHLVLPLQLLQLRLQVSLHLLGISSPPGGAAAVPAGRSDVGGGEGGRHRVKGRRHLVEGVPVGGVVDRVRPMVRLSEGQPQGVAVRVRLLWTVGRGHFGPLRHQGLLPAAVQLLLLRESAAVACATRRVGRQVVAVHVAVR
ncbi:hypothetical protein E2C01_051080 [Portunus trituberculatus]|uniref:Uncharacterized protein n=1 Tax=Portunus trituberculatus TaxID=210409 RepID=A0A5B7GHN5_PORTR|nr:hypothetical protein [Portunus trituberculatus]